MKRFEGDRIFLGRNPEAGVALTYRLAADAKEVKLTIRDGANQVVREVAGEAMKDRNQAGINVVQWDLRHQPLRPLRNQPAPGGAGGGGGFGGGGNNGPFVLPGTYRATLTVDGRDANIVTVTVRGDSSIAITDADRRTWHDTAMTLHDMQGKANDLADQVAEAWTRFQSIEQQAKGATLPPALKTQMESLGKDLESVRRRLGLAGGGGFGGNPENVRGRIGQIKNGVMASTSLPTEVQLRQKREVEAAWPKVVADANAAMSRLPNVAKEVVAAAFLRQ
jgi:hypothetical protein